MLQIVWILENHMKLCKNLAKSRKSFKISTKSEYKTKGLKTSLAFENLSLKNVQKALKIRVILEIQIYRFFFSSVAPES